MGNAFGLSWEKNRGGELLEAWPRDSAGELEEPALLCSCKCLDMSDQLRINMLQAYGIPCLCKDRGDGNFGRVIMGISGEGVDLYVPKSMLDDAKALCEEVNDEDL